MRDNSRVNAGRQAQGTNQPHFTDCHNCGTADHTDYACPCGCHRGTRQGTKSASMFPTFSAPSQASAERIAGILAQRQIESKIVGRKDSITVYVPTKLVNRAVSIIFGL